MILFKPDDWLILIVDDVSQNLQVLGEMVEREGYKTTFALSGKQALKRVETAHPDLILLDLMMPEMNGVEVCKTLKTNPDLCDIPIVFLTGSNELNNLLQAFNVGAADYITKPFRPEEVMVRIKTQLNNQMLKKKLEEQNKQLKVEIELRRRVEEQLQQAKESAESANRIKSIFLSNMSHELRTPLNAIFGFAQLMQVGSNLTPDQQKNLNIIRKSGEHLLNLINDVLNLSKIEAGRITVNQTDFDLIEMLWEMEEMFRLKANEKCLDLELVLESDVPRLIVSDRTKLRQVLINLIGNAIKFTNEGGVSLRVRSIIGNGEDTNYLLHFEVEDTGVGIASDELNNIFQPFVQSEAGFAAPEGTGLGLTISRKYIQLLGGDISVKSQLGWGTTFQFQIPVTLTETARRESNSPSRRVTKIAPDQPRYRILVVDDKPSNRELLLQMLCQVGFEVQEAENGLEAIEIWQYFEPHLIFMDMRMPVMDGYEVTQKIKATLKDKTGVIIAITASAFEEEKAKILSVGCDDIIYKPFLNTTIFEKITQHLGVQFVYVTDINGSNQADTPVDLAAALKNIPNSLLNQLESAAIVLDEKAIYHAINKIEPQETDIVKMFKMYAENFDYDKIVEAIAQIKQS